MYQISLNPIIFSTSNYNLFKFFEANRPPLHWKKIMQSIEKKDLTKYVPILVVGIKGFFYIIDGQNRFLACKQLGLPIYYIELPNDCGEDIMHMLNIDRKNWTLENYLNYWVTLGKEEYKKVQSILSECINFSVGDVLNIWQNNTRRGGSDDVFKKGLYSLPQKGINKIRIVYAVLNAIEQSVDKTEYKPQKALVSAISSLLVCGANPNVLISRIKSYPHLFKKQADQPHYFAMLEHIYNYRTRDKIAFKYRLGKQNGETHY